MKRLLSFVTIGFAACCVLAPTANAHVSANPNEQTAESFTKIEFRVPNERAEATTQVEIQIPEGVTYVSVQPTPGWTFKTKTTKLDEPIEVHGEDVTEYTSQITFSGGKINPGEFQSFYVGMRMPDKGELGDWLFFPAIQTYAGGEEVSWIDKPEDEKGDPHAAENPAPYVTLAAAEDEHGAATDDEDEHGDKDDEDAAKMSKEEDEGEEYVSSDDFDDETDRLNMMAIGALALSVLALLFSMFRGRKRD